MSALDDLEAEIEFQQKELIYLDGKLTQLEEDMKFMAEHAPMIYQAMLNRKGLNES